MDFPDKPGVYLMKGDTEVVYIGKAKSLKHRISSYFQKHVDAKTEDIVRHTKDIEFFVCENEVDALVLEANLIKEYNPRFNIRLKDDTHYPYLKVTHEDFPQVLVTRDVDNGTVYGPFGSAKALRKSMKFMRKLFPLRSCSTLKKKECLEYHIGLCPAPCTGRISKEEYQVNVRRMITFMEGKVDELISELSGEMEEASDRLDFEKAALIRDRIDALKKSRLTQIINRPSLGNIDVIVATGQKKKCFTVMVVRRGKIIGKHQYVLESDVEEFVVEFYADRLVPDEIVVQGLDPVVGTFLEKKKGKKVKITTPKRGKKRKLLNMAEKDAEIHLKYVYGELELLRDELGLAAIPERIEGYDVSNIMGQQATASQVCFIDGKPSKRNYRHYRIRTTGIDDYAMIEEVLRRRFEHRENMPDLILIDGGKGHLGVALKTLEGLGLPIPVVALAKREEDVYSRGLGDVSDVSKRVLIRVRDEAHRFAVQYHRKLRQKRLKTSILDEIEGVGEKRKRVLMKAFGSVEMVKKSSLEELYAVLKNRKVAEKVYAHFHRG
jgi:excinuclease ABC subunit C